ncbi:MAG: DNA helicase RecQ, partial [Acidobacteria bacterium]|nr:DNA helicase RecQ [Acidobacteriota bacterium]
MRRDIAGQLHLDRPRILVGSFDRPNLVYRVRRRLNLQKQIDDVLARHPGQPGIIYCIRRADVDQLSGELCRRGYRAGPYHAGMTDEERRKSQNSFVEDRLDLI